MADTFEGFAIVELMGHRRLAGYVTEQEIAGAAFIRLDVPGPETPRSGTGGDEAVALKGGFTGGVTQFYAPGAVYCITPTTEDIAYQIGSRSAPAPVSRYELEPPAPREPDPWAADDGPVEAVVHAYDCAGGDCQGECDG